MGTVLVVFVMGILAFVAWKVLDKETKSSGSFIFKLMLALVFLIFLVVFTGPPRS